MKLRFYRLNLTETIRILCVCKCDYQGNLLFGFNLLTETQYYHRFAARSLELVVAILTWRFMKTLHAKSKLEVIWHWPLGVSTGKFRLHVYTPIYTGTIHWCVRSSTDKYRFHIYAPMCTVRREYTLISRVIYVGTSAPRHALTTLDEFNGQCIVIRCKNRETFFIFIFFILFAHKHTLKIITPVTQFLKFNSFWDLSSLCICINTRPTEFVSLILFNFWPHKKGLLSAFYLDGKTFNFFLPAPHFTIILPKGIVFDWLANY